MLRTYVSFLTSFPQRRKTILKTSISFFNALATKKENYAQNLWLIMPSKRTMLWKEYMSREKRQ
jgi:hypothetical protein